MGGERETVAIGSVAQIFDGPHATPSTQAIGPVFLGIDALENGRLKLNAARCVSESVFAEWTRRVTPMPGDLVFSYETRIGQAALIPPNFRCCLGRRLALARIDRERVHPEYLLYYYLAPDFQKILRAHTKPGSTVDRIHLSDFPKFPIVLPPLAEQGRIVELLSSLDDRIALNKEMGETLEAIARTLFQSWFVDFDLVRRAAAGEDTGLPPHIAALFLACLTNEGRPEGWTSTALPEMATFLNGLALQRFPATDDVPSLPVIKIAEMRTGTKATSARATSALPSDDYIVSDGDHLFSWSGSLTHCLWSHGPGALNQHLFKVIPTTAPAWFCYFAVDHFLPEFQRIAAAKAVTMGHIQRYHLDQAALAMPPKKSLERLGDVIEPMFDRLKSLPQENRILATLRDTLLPKLISGELRIREAEAVIENI